MEFTTELDARGLVCPEPLMLVRKAVREMQPGEVLYVVATDPSTERDLNNFCRFMGHSMQKTERADHELRFWIQKA